MYLSNKLEGPTFRSSAFSQVVQHGPIIPSLGSRDKAIIMAYCFISLAKQVRATVSGGKLSQKVRWRLRKILDTDTYIPIPLFIYCDRVYDTVHDKKDRLATVLHEDWPVPWVIRP